MFQIRACLEVTLPSYSSSHFATSTAVTLCNSSVIFLPQTFFGRCWSLREKKGWEHQEIMPHINWGESRRQVEALQTQVFCQFTVSLEMQVSSAGAINFSHVSVFWPQIAKNVQHE